VLRTNGNRLLGNKLRGVYGAKEADGEDVMSWHFWERVAGTSVTAVPSLTDSSQTLWLVNHYRRYIRRQKLKLVRQIYLRGRKVTN
jgi:hypothetical protein